MSAHPLTVSADLAKEIHTAQLIDGSLDQFPVDLQQLAADEASTLSLRELLDWVDIADIIDALPVTAHNTFYSQARQMVAAAIAEAQS